MTQIDISNIYEKKNIPSKLLRYGIIILSIGIILSILSFLLDPARASFNTIIIFTFVYSIGICSLFLVALEYLAGAVWSVPFRRISEILAALLIFAPILALPVIVNPHFTFHWSNLETVTKDAILSVKTPYLNMTFFIIRNLAIFLIAIIFFYFITRNSGKQDLNPKQSYTKANLTLSGAFIPFFAISVTILAVDWLMSLEPHWFSTIFGVYYFSGSLLAALAALTLIAVILQQNGYLMKGLGRDHFYSLGALLFAFTNFWAYIAFSQFLLIWYANLPEETTWFMGRWEGNWKFITIGIMLARFIIPYIALLTQPSKSDLKRLKLVSIWILFSHLYDMYWLTMPNFNHSGIVIGWQEFAFPFVGIGLIILVFYFFAKNKNMVPIGDPKLKRTIDFHL
ncbi:MAG: quinol:cytochrome C oxidoreductase [FCB group bacterium]|jgi:hypothetical protein